jgi:DNA-binding protein Fis
MFAHGAPDEPGEGSRSGIERALSDQVWPTTKCEGGDLSMVIDQIGISTIDRALAKCNGVKTKAADFLRINRNTLNRR